MLKLLKQSDMPAVLAYLYRYPVEAAFLLGNILTYGIEKRSRRGRSGDYFGYYIGAELKGVIAFYNLGSCIPHYESQEAIAELSRLMLRRNYKMVLGFHKMVGPLIECLGSKKPLRENAESQYMINRQLKPFALEGALFKTAAEVGEIRAADFVANAYRRGYNDIKSRQEILKMFREHTEDEQFLFLLINGEIKAQAYVQTSTPAIAQIGGVYTMEEERGRGYCKAITSEFSRRIICKGKLPSLIVRNDNIPAKRAYEHIGFCYYDDYSIVKF